MDNLAPAARQAVVTPFDPFKIHWDRNGPQAGKSLTVANMVDPALGQINQSGDPNAIFLKVFSGEVLTAFKLATIADKLQRTRSIASGKSAQFPAVGWLQAYFHQPGVEILGQQGVQNEKIVLIDDLLISPVFIPNIEEAKAHFDIRGEYSYQVGQALARSYDNRVIRAMTLSARAAANLSAAGLSAPAAPVLQQSAGGALPAAALFFKITYVTAVGETLPSAETTLTPTLNNVVTVLSPANVAGAVGYNVYASTVTNTEKLQTASPIPVGQNFQLSATPTTTGVVVPASNSTITNAGTFAGAVQPTANVDTSATTLRTAIFNAIMQLDLQNIPKEDRFILLKPNQFWLLFQDTSFGFLANSFFGGKGGVADGSLPMIGGVPVHVSNNFPVGNVSAISGEQNTYSGNFTNTVALVGHKSAVGTVKLVDLQTESEYSVRYQGTTIVSKMALGTGILRPEAMVEIQHT